MKTRLLKKLRKEAEKAFPIVYRKPLYWVFDSSSYIPLIRTSKIEIAQVNADKFRRTYMYNMLNKLIYKYSKHVRHN